MKILHVYKDFDPPVRGGIERHVALMCRYQRQWADVEALTCSRAVTTRVVVRDGTRVTEVGEFGRFQSAPLSPLFPRYLKRAAADADVVVLQMPNPTAELAWQFARPEAALVVRYQSDVVRQAAAMRLYGPLQRRFLAQADVILPSSRQYLETSPLLQDFEDRCRVVPLGIDPDAFAPPPAGEIAALRARYGGRFVLFCGRHRYYKGIPYLIAATPDVNAQVVIAGDGPERARCVHLARGLQVKALFPGELDQQALVLHLHACELVVFPSVERSEAFGLGILEAHACGKPVVATKLGTGVELANLDGVTGFNVPPRDPKALAEAVNALLEDHARREEMGRRARERVRADFHAESVARQELEIYREVLR